MSYRLPAKVAFALQASMVVSFLAGSSAPTPLYAVYRAEWGFTPITTTVVFGVYALAVLVALLTVGSLSDHIGRKPVLLVAAALQAATMLVFTRAGGVDTLLVARVIQGLSTGAAVGALGAGLLDLDTSRGTLANAVAPMTGTGSGALLSGLLVQYLPSPTHLVFLVLFVVFVVQAVGVSLMRETASPRSGALASLRPQLAVPSAVRRRVLLAAPVLIAAWSLAGFYGSLGPSLVRLVTGSSSFVFAGLALFVLAGSGAVAVLLLRTASPDRVMLIGTASLVGGVAVILLAVLVSSSILLLIGTAVAGVGFGGGFQGGLRTVVPLAQTHERAGVLSTLFVVSYLAMGVPAVLAGYLVVHGGGVRTTALEYAGAVIGLAASALVGLVVERRSTTQDADVQETRSLLPV